MRPTVDTSRMTRQVYEMPDDIAAALDERDLTEAYDARPAYQQNDYVGWITRAKRAETRARRLEQMLDELERGTLYMNMKWTAGQ